MVFSGKEGNIGIFLFSSTKCLYHATIICISNHALPVCFKYKRHIINFLLTSLALYVG